MTPQMGCFPNSADVLRPLIFPDCFAAGRSSKRFGSSVKARRFSLVSSCFNNRFALALPSLSLPVSYGLAFRLRAPLATAAERFAVPESRCFGEFPYLFPHSFVLVSLVICFRVSVLSVFSLGPGKSSFVISTESSFSLLFYHSKNCRLICSGSAWLPLLPVGKTNRFSCSVICGVCV
jgi:hypothetical protein